MDMWPENPALVLGRAYDVLAGNQLADALFDGFLHGAGQGCSGRDRRQR